MNLNGKKRWEICLFSAIGLALYELAAESSFFLMESFFILTAFFFPAEERKLLFSPTVFVKNSLCLFTPIWTVWTTIGIYLIWEIVSVGYSSYPQGTAEKYRVVLLMAGLSFLFLQSDKIHSNGIEILEKTMMYAGTAAAAIGLLHAFIPVIYPVLYGKRISLRIDYNLFSQVILMGMTAGIQLVREKRFARPFEFGLILLCAPAIILSSSRRNTVFLIVVLLLRMADELFLKKSEKKKRTLARWSLLFVLIFFITAALQWGLNRQYERLMQREVEIALQSAGSALERYEPGKKEQGSSKRKLIWSIAAEEYLSFSDSEKIFGKGFGYDRLLYQISDSEELTQAYSAESRKNLSAHCFVLTDLLNGGAVQAVLGISIWVQIGVYLLKMLLEKQKDGMFFVVTLGMVFLNNLISNRYGFLYDKYFWLLLCGLTMKNKTESLRKAEK